MRLVLRLYLAKVRFVGWFSKIDIYLARIGNIHAKAGCVLTLYATGDIYTFRLYNWNHPFNQKQQYIFLEYGVKLEGLIWQKKWSAN